MEEKKLDEKFENWAAGKAREWVNALIERQRERGLVLNICGMEYLILKALRAGRDYKEEPEKEDILPVEQPEHVEEPAAEEQNPA